MRVNTRHIINLLFESELQSPETVRHCRAVPGRIVEPGQPEPRHEEADSAGWIGWLHVCLPQRQGVQRLLPARAKQLLFPVVRYVVTGA